MASAPLHASSADFWIETWGLTNYELRPMDIETRLTGLGGNRSVAITTFSNDPVSPHVICTHSVKSSQIWSSLT
jgi:hypothetical protein